MKNYNEDSPRMFIKLILTRHPVHAISILDKGATFVDKTHKEEQTGVFAL